MTTAIMVSNITADMVRPWKVPITEIEDLKKTYEEGEKWYWLIAEWNRYGLTANKLCPACPDSIAVVRAFLPLLWE
jgi:hypothetical protein